MHFRLHPTTTPSLLLASFLLVGTRPVGAATVPATINSINAWSQRSLGDGEFCRSPDGLVITPKLSGVASRKARKGQFTGQFCPISPPSLGRTVSNVCMVSSVSGVYNVSVSHRCAKLTPISI